MQVLTETALRAMHLNSGDTVTVEKDSFVTESARRYAAERGIRIAGQEDAPENDDCGGMFDVCKCGFMLAEKDNPDNKGCGWLYTYCEYGFTFI